ncbi:2Fe-2S iron-sulfur cluster-binding protein [Breoghania sp.]|uniref:2Fe-2S iron-sulfur cluster-binding protein n=1 Tax=Breoghania sp. TaxID=2065378 RepID=UPI002AA84326|nr:2Fe-2S iron-sulfur cluster-binding protein [Breoghania sp.]
MVKVTYVAFDGTETTVEGEPGASVMQTALDNNVEGIVGECGGSMMCATCHCHVDDAWVEKAGPRNDGEDDMLECAASDVTPTSRLSCQIKLSEDLDGLRVLLPEEQV